MSVQTPLRPIGWFLALLIVIPPMAGSNYRGVVRAGGQAIPGATVIATQAASKVTTTTDEAGTFEFAGLVDGDCTVEVQMLGFAPLRRLVPISAKTDAANWDLTFLTKDALVAGLHPGGAAPAAPRATRRTGPPREFQQVNVTESAGAETLGTDTGLRTEEASELSQSAANSFVVQGSVSSAAGLPMQNDWGPRPGMEGLGGMGPMGMLGMQGSGQGQGMGADAQTQPPTPPMAGGPGRGGPGMGGGPGGPGGFGGRGGPGGPGGPGARGQGRPEWQGRRDSMAFGNNRRNPRLRYMGMAMLNLNDAVWDARAFSVTGAQVNKPDYSNLRGGFMFGGPLRIPKLVHSNRQIMMTIDYQFGRNRTGTVSEPVNMPTALERAGDFSETLVGGAPVVVYDPTTNTPFAGNRIPATRISSTATGLLGFFPSPNLPFAVRNYQSSWTGVNDTHNLNARVMNVRVGSKDRFNGSIGYQHSTSESPNLFEFIDLGAGRGLNAGLGWSHNFSTRLINTMQFSFSRMRQQATPFFADVENVAARLGIEGTSGNPMNWGPPTVQLTNYAGLRDGNYSLNRNQTASIGNTLMVTRGVHSFSFGGNYRRLQFNALSDSNGRGTWTFNGSATSYRVNGVAQNGTGYDLADMLLGLPTTSSIRYGNPDKYFRSSGYDLFLNDDWRLHPKFTLNVGLRWDYSTPVSELYGRLVNLSLSDGYRTATPIVAGGAGESLIHPDRNNFSPRLGFAWRPTTGRSTVVRGGYGVYYNTSVYNILASNMAQQPPFAQVLNVASTVDNPLSIANGFVPSLSALSSSTFAVDPRYRIGYAQTWQLSMQHDLPFGMFGSVGYLGTKGTRLDQQFLPNTVAPGAIASGLPQGFIYQTSNGNSIYHAAQFQLNRRFRTGLGWGASYQLSKSIDNAGTGGRGQGGTPVAQNWLDYSAERGLSSFDARHTLSIQAQYSTGMGRAGGTLIEGWRGMLLKDWTISSNIAVRSGNPFTATVGGNRSQVQGTSVSNTVRANATGLSVDAPGMLFNTAAFTEPAAGQWGTAGRNTIPGPTTFFLNSGVGRVFRLGERRSVDIQMQAQNLLNHVVITSWGTVVGANNYGLGTGAAAMRRMTLSARFRF